jgi:hypothetical protein
VAETGLPSTSPSSRSRAASNRPSSSEQTYTSMWLSSSVMPRRLRSPHQPRRAYPKIGGYFKKK